MILIVLTHEFTFSNNFYKILGIPMEDRIQDINIWAELLHPKERDKILEEVRLILADQKENHDIECSILNATGQYVPALIRGFMTRSEIDNSPLRVTGTLMDISRLNKAEQKIKNLLSERD